MSKKSSKITQCMKNPRNLNTHGKRQSTSANKMTQTMEFSGTNFKVVIIKKKNARKNSHKHSINTT